MLALMHDRDTVCRDCVSLISMTSPFLARSGVEAAIPQGYRLLRMWGRSFFSSMHAIEGCVL
jgi:hypothetical protein